MWSKKTKQDSNVQSDQGNGHKDKGQASTVVGAKADGSKEVISTNYKLNMSMDNYVANEVELDSEVDEVLIMEKPMNGTKKGASTSSDAGFNV
ncbi:hypothetical protein Tco_0444189 [Tanacetum coccineum]